MCGFSSCGTQCTKMKSEEIVCLVMQREKIWKKSQYQMWHWWVHCLSDFNSRSGDKVFLSLSPDLPQLWAKQVFSPCFWCSSLKMNCTNLNYHKMNWYYSQVRAYTAPGYSIWPIPQYQLHAGGKSKILTLTVGAAKTRLRSGASLPPPCPKSQREERHTYLQKTAPAFSNRSHV